MSIFGVKKYTFDISGDLDMQGNRIIDVKNPSDSLDAVNRKYVNKRLEFKTKLLADKLAEVSARLDKENIDSLERHRVHYASIQQNKDEIDKLRTDLPGTDTSLITANIHNLQNQILALQDVIYGTEALHSDLNLGNNRIINIEHPRNPQDNPAYERDVVTAKYLYDYVKIADKKFISRSDAKAFLTNEESESFLGKEEADKKFLSKNDAEAYLTREEADKKYLKANEDNVLDGRLDMKEHRIIGLADPVQEDGAVTRRYLSSRTQALVDGDSELRRRIDRLERLAQQ